MTKRTERELHLALIALLRRVKVQNNWSALQFATSAKTIDKLNSSEAVRFHKALADNGYLEAIGKRKFKLKLNVNVWKNDDSMLVFVKEVLELIPDFTKQRGRKPSWMTAGGTIVPVKDPEPEEIIQPSKLEEFSSKDLVEELRKRGWEVKCTKIEEL